jgi:hypothetical protein
MSLFHPRGSGPHGNIQLGYLQNLFIGIDRYGEAAALKAHGADVALSDLADWF